MKPAIKISGVNYFYNKLHVLEDINLVINEGDFVALVGPNGGGKTTLIRLIMGLTNPYSGEINIYDKTPASGRNLIGYVPQFLNIDNDFPISVMNVISMGLERKNNLIPWLIPREKKLIEEISEKLFITALLHKAFGELSGGEKQRVLIARAIISSPEILILDEPTASVDISVEQSIYDLFKEYNKQATILLVTHDVGFTSKYVNKIACLNKKIICHTADTFEAEQVIKETYDNEVNMVLHKHNF